MWSELCFSASSAQAAFPRLPYGMPTYILKICVCWRSSSNILETLALGWDSFGFEYKIIIACWLLVILEAKEKKKPKSCQVSKLSVSVSSFQAVTALSLQKALLALSLQAFRTKTLPINWISQCVSMGKPWHQWHAAPSNPKREKRLIKSLRCATSSSFYSTVECNVKVFHTSHNFFWFLTFIWILGCSHSWCLAARFFCRHMASLECKCLDVQGTSGATSAPAVLVRDCSALLQRGSCCTLHFLPSQTLVVRYLLLILPSFHSPSWRRELIHNLLQCSPILEQVFPY